MKKYSPLVSVIIPTFNNPKYFKLALESALNQTYKNIEVVVSDSSTNDDTEKIVNKYLRKDKRIKYFHHKNFSLNENWNFCRHYNNPDAEFVNWLMDDDLFYPRKIKTMLEIYSDNPKISLVASNYDFIDANGKILPKAEGVEELNDYGEIYGDVAGRILFILEKNYIGNLTNVLIKKKFLRDNDLCYCADEKGAYPLADVSTWLQLLSKGNLYFIDTPLSAQRFQSDNDAIFAMCWANLIKCFWKEKIFLEMISDVRFAFLGWMKNAAKIFMNAKEKDFHGEKLTALEDLNIAMAEALHGDYEIIFPPSVENILKNLYEVK